MKLSSRRGDGAPLQLLLWGLPAASFGEVSVSADVVYCVPASVPGGGMLPCSSSLEGHVDVRFLINGDEGQAHAPQ
jgi:hypothetical protein